MRRVIIESPFAGDVERNLTYLRRAMNDALFRGEAPFASHGLYTQPGVLRDEIEEERKMGIHAGFAWWNVAEIVVLYVDYGISRGMQAALEHALRIGKPTEERRIGENP